MSATTGPAIRRRCRSTATSGSTSCRRSAGRSPMIDIAYVPTMCNHCDNAPCMKADKTAARSRSATTASCSSIRSRPRAARIWSTPAPTATSGGTRSCNCRSTGPFDAHLIDQGWQQTRGHQSCPTGAMRAIKVEDDEMARMAREQGLEVMKPELGTKPRVYYRNLWRYSKCFIGGSVSAEANGVVDCVEGASVRLLKDGALVARDHDRQLRRLQIRQARRGLRPLHRADLRRPALEGAGGRARRQRQSRRDQAVASSSVSCPRRRASSNRSVCRNAYAAITGSSAFADDDKDGIRVIRADVD